MATYLNNLRLKEIVTGDEDGTWGTSTNTNLELITDGFSFGTKEMAADANETFTMPDATADATRSLYLKFTSAVDLTATREITLGPNTISKTWIIENATSGSQTITIKQGSGATVDVASGSKVMIVTDGAGAGAAVLNANPTEAGGTVTSVGGTGTVNGISLSGTVTSSGNLTLGGALTGVDLTSQVTGTLPIANGGTGTTSTTFADLATNVTGTLPIANGGTNLTSLGTANQVLAVNAGGTALEYQSAATGSVTSVGGTGTVQGLTLSGTVTSSGSLTLGGSLADVDLTSQVTGTLPVANGGTGAATLTANNVLLGNGTSALQAVAPGTSGNVLTSNGTTWQSSTGAGALVDYITSVTAGVLSSTLTVDNAAFDDSTYDYLIIEVENAELMSSPPNTHLTFQYRKGGVNQTASAYGSAVLTTDATKSTSNNNTKGLLLGISNNFNAISIGGVAYFSMRIYHQKPGYPQQSSGVLMSGGTFTFQQAYYQAAAYNVDLNGLGGIQISYASGAVFGTNTKLKLYGVKES